MDDDDYISLEIFKVKRATSLTVRGVERLSSYVR